METRIIPGTIARTLCLFIALVNQLLAVVGKSPLPLDDATIELLVSTLATIITAVISWWKNNDFTLNARKAGVYLRQLREGDDHV